MGRIELIGVLLKEGANINSIDKAGKNALMWTLLSKRGSPELSRILLENGADVNARGHWNETPLMMAAQDDSINGILRVLIEHNAEVDLQDKDGNTALLHAAFEGCNENVKVLLAAGANPRHRDKKGFTAWGAAGSSGDIRTMLTLGWERILVPYLIIIGALVIIALLIYPLSNKMSANAARRRNFLKKIFFIQVLSYIPAAVLVILGFWNLEIIPTFTLSLLIGFIALGGILGSLVSFYISRRTNQSIV
jgi:hypothetical protein